MAFDQSTVIGVYAALADLKAALKAFRTAGQGNIEVSVLIPSIPGTGDFSPGRYTDASTARRELAGLARLRTLVVPRLGPVLAAGPIGLALSDALKIAPAGGLAGILTYMNVERSDASHYENRVKSGALLVCIHADDGPWINTARVIFEQTGAEDASTLRAAPL